MPSSSSQDLGPLYDLLVQAGRSQQRLTVSDLERAVSHWSGGTAETYRSKQLKAIIKDKQRGRAGSPGSFKITRNIAYLRKDDFLERISQKENILPSYERGLYTGIVKYEFLMPLTREDRLRENLDRLFYCDRLEELIRSIDPDKFQVFIPKESLLQEDYVKKIASEAADLFGGYSISHVNGRFRAAPLMEQKDTIGKRYIIDETTAIVRFIIPLEATRTSMGETFLRAFEEPSSVTTDGQAATSLLKKIRGLFFLIFAEVVVHSVQGEDEIWLLETAMGSERLYKWSVKHPD